MVIANVVPFGLDLDIDFSDLEGLVNIRLFSNQSA